MERISQTLTQRVKELAERYATPLPQMSSRVAELEAKGNGHLARMGGDEASSTMRLLLFLRPQKGTEEHRKRTTAKVTR